MRNGRLALGFALAALGAALPAFGAPASPAGDWMTPSGVKVRVASCASNRSWLCASILTLPESVDKRGATPRDTANADPALRERPLVGIQILSDMKPAGPGAWKDGKIYELKAGKTYDGKVSANPDGTLKVEGCVSVLCRAVTWTRVN